MAVLQSVTWLDIHLGFRLGNNVPGEKRILLVERRILKVHRVTGQAVYAVYLATEQVFYKSTSGQLTKFVGTVFILRFQRQQV